MLIAEDLLLLLFDDESGKADAWAAGYVDIALGGAVLAELALLGAAEVSEPKGFFRARSVGATGTADVDDPVLREALATIAEEDRSASSLVSKLQKGLRERLLARLTDKGILERRQETVLWVFDRDRWPSVDAGHERELRRELHAVLLQGSRPTGRVGVLVSLLLAIEQLHRVVDTETLSNRELKRRGKEIASGSWATEAVEEYVMATVMAAIVPSVVAAGVM